jgi:hypothetical protein
MLGVHQQVSINILERTLHIEREESCLYIPFPGSLGDALEPGKPLDPATSSAYTVRVQFRGLHNPSRVIRIGGLPTRISRTTQKIDR